LGALGQQFGVTLTQAVAVARSLFCFGLPSPTSLPLDYQWIYASSKFVNQVNCNWEEWRNQEIHLLVIVPVCIELLKLWSHYTGLSEFQQIDFIEWIATLDMPPNNV
jgi:hypothetical protein